MIFQGVPERFPKLRLAFLEIGCTWLPYWLDRMDEHWEKRGKIETPSLTRLPSACVREQPIYFSYEPEENLLPETFRSSGRVISSTPPIFRTGMPSSREPPSEQKRKDLSDESKNLLLYEQSLSDFIANEFDTEIEPDKSFRNWSMR